jgi:hypothetical protein
MRNIMTSFKSNEAENGAPLPPLLSQYARVIQILHPKRPSENISEKE